MKRIALKRIKINMCFYSNDLQSYSKIIFEYTSDMNKETVCRLTAFEMEWEWLTEGEGTYL